MPGQCGDWNATSPKVRTQSLASNQVSVRQIQELDMTIYCRTCGFRDFRTSHFRFRTQDLAHLLQLRMPVRCMTCGERDYAPLSLILKLRSERKARHRESRSTA